MKVFTVTRCLLLTLLLVLATTANKSKHAVRRSAFDAKKLVYTGPESRVKVNSDCSPIPSMTALTACAWLKANAMGEKTTIMSYAVAGQPNELKFYISATLRVYTYVSGEWRYDNIQSDGWQDNEWMHLCYGWDNSGVLKGYLNGVLVKDSTGLSDGVTVTGGGVMYLGQEQDTLGGGFDNDEALVGELTSFNLWSRRLSDAEIADVYDTCSVIDDSLMPDVFTWDVYHLDIEPTDVSVEYLDAGEPC
ncbi:neuronal pentraxin-1-like [Saccoglossus kowalevskii]|uniref:Pentraxin family member n=1 Tax=Saccoglossus kowalevskii TaxID=10224 RepID=A0ABM0GW61_SACKO|nr:PREDICTED: neuronal pentraxin-1-like [Saccoglossus kowalevskii]